MLLSCFIISDKWMKICNAKIIFFLFVGLFKGFVDCSKVFVNIMKTKGKYSWFWFKVWQWEHQLLIKEITRFGVFKILLETGATIYGETMVCEDLFIPTERSKISIKSMGLFLPNSDPANWELKWSWMNEKNREKAALWNRNLQL